jgi:hypothetical protein
MALTVPTRILSFLLLAVCSLAGQQRDELRRAADSLPEAPPVQTATRIQTLRRFADEARLSVMESPVSEAQSDFGSLYYSRLMFCQETAQKEPPDFIEKYFYHSSLKPNGRYHFSSSSSFMGRAAHAASSILVTRDAGGKTRLNTSYLFAVLSAAATHSAQQPYWRRSVAQPFSDFGATIGNDAGTNVFHEFEPGIRQLVKSHEPRFVSRIEARIKR